MNANPVLLLVTGITALVGAMAFLRNSQEAAAVTAKDLNEQLEKQSAIYEKLAKDNEVYSKLDLAYARERGATEEELTKIKEDAAKKQVDLLYDNFIQTQKTFDKISALYFKDKATLEEYNDAKKKEQDSYDKWRDGVNAKNIADAERDADKAEKLREEQAKKDEERRKKEADRLKKIKEDREKAYADEVERRKQSTEELEELETMLLKNKIDRANKEKDLKDSKNEEDLKRLQVQHDLEMQFIEKREQVKKQAAEWDKKRRDKEIELASDGFKLIGDFTELMGKRTEKERRRAFKIKKAADLASATIDGTKAVLSTYADTPGGPIIKGVAAGIAGAFSAIQIAKISKQQFEGGGSFDGGNNSSGGGGIFPTNPSTQGGVIAPTFNVNSGTTNQLNTLQQQPIQAYVVSGQVTSAQALDRNRIKNATL